MLYSKINMLLVSTSDEIDSMLKRVEQNVFNEFDIVGIVLADREPEENELIEGIPVVSKIDTVTEYIQTRWVDALLVGIKKKTLIPEDLFETCVNMGITVHECLDNRTGWTGNQFINRMGGYTVLTSSVRVISSRQAMMKRTMGGVLAAAMMMMSALPAAGAVDVSHLNGTSSSTLTQAAADMLPSLSVAPMTELATVVSYENGDLTVKTADGDELVLHTENAIVMDTQTAAAADLSALKAGESVYV